MTPPRVSVLIPTYNYARYLPEAIESVLAQDFEEFELVISEDCSADGSAEVIARYAAKDPRIRFRVQPANLGLVPNSNWCLAQARGEFVKFLCADDKLASRETLGKLVHLLETNPSATLAASARYVIQENSAITAVWDHFGATGLYRGTDVIRRCLEQDANLIGEPSAVMFRRRDAGFGFDPSYTQLLDLRMWFALLEKGDLAYTPEPLCAFRRHGHQQTEMNRLRGTANPEHLRLFWEYHRRPFLDPAHLPSLSFHRIYSSRKRRNRDPESVQIESALAKDMGRLRYAAYWVRHKLLRPFQHLRRWFERRCFGVDASPACGTEERLGR